jgi:hypothetical protein
MMMIIPPVRMLFEDELIKKESKNKEELKIENLETQKIINKQLSK